MVPCPTCDREFSSPVALMQHTENNCVGAEFVHKGISQWERARQQRGVFTTGNGGEFNYLVANEDAYDCYRGEYVCDVCDGGFERLISLNQHLSSGVHHGANYSCDSCHATFGKMSQLMQHQQRGRCSASSGSRLGRVLVSDYTNAGTLMLTNGAAPRLSVEATLKFDGGARPNPGHGGAGYFLIDRTNNSQMCKSKVYISGDRVTSNQAEYVGLIQGLKYAKAQRIKILKVQGDSKLVINQMTGVFKARNEILRNLRNEAQSVASYFSSITYEHIPRERNKVADQLAAAAINEASHNCDDKYYGLGVQYGYDSDSDDYW